ncbi:exocyst complex subunit 5 [Planoprotostelium fungivorum]|uniref:Exocyst complex subunit 5 n=1 Tax=Planoprotostelium fungivorum TaxID=1890364 RepID=A0A2P6NVN0_9EUKA|nr:exocyst complex subunit 5 [Planoprotostelium fungivorum]
MTSNPRGSVRASIGLSPDILRMSHRNLVSSDSDTSPPPVRTAGPTAPPSRQSSIRTIAVSPPADQGRQAKRSSLKMETTSKTSSTNSSRQSSVSSIKEAIAAENNVQSNATHPSYVWSDAVPKLSAEFFTRESFQQDEFIERITRKTIFLEKEARKKEAQNHTNTPMAFRCQVFVDAFRQTLDSLYVMAQETDDNILTLESETKVAQDRYKSKLKEFGDQFEDIFKQFKDLDGRITKVGSGAVTIGDRLETGELLSIDIPKSMPSPFKRSFLAGDTQFDADDVQRERALDAKELTEYLVWLNSEDPELDKNAKLLDMFLQYNSSVDKYRKKKNAVKKHHRRQLLTGSTKSLDANSTMGQLYEKAIMSKKLMNVITDLDSDKMDRSKKRVVVVYHSLERKLVSDFADARKDSDYNRIRQLSLILFDFNGGESCIAQYIARYKTLHPNIVNHDASLATRLKPEATDLETTAIDSRLNEFFEKMRDICREEGQMIYKVFDNPNVVMSQFINALFGVRIKSFLRQLLGHDKEVRLSLYMKTLYQSYVEVLSLLEGFADFKLGPELLEQEGIINMLFSEDQQNYAKHEETSLKGIYKAELEEAQGPLRRQNNVEVLGTSMISAFTAKTDFISVGSQAVKRCLILSHKQDIPSNLCMVFNILIDFLIGKYVTDALVKAVNNIPDRIRTPYDKQLAFIDDFFLMILTVNQIVLSTQEHFHVDVSRHIAASANDLSQCESRKNIALFRLEEKIDEGMTKALNDILSKFESPAIFLDYYRLRDDDSSLFSGNSSATCASLIQFMRGRCEAITQTLDGKNMDLLLEEFGRCMFQVLWAHYKQIKVSQGAGGLRLLQDLVAYRESAKMFRSEHIGEAFDLLREITKVHNVPPEQLKVVISDTILASVEKNEILSFVQQRSDYKAFWIGKYV